MRFVAGRGAVVAKLLRPGDATERDAAGRGTVVDLLAEAPWRRRWQGAPWWICWPGRQGGAAGRGYRGEEDAALWQEWQHREETAGDGAVHKKTCRGIGVRNLGRCAMIILLLKTH